ncbi:hypothetical protein BX616_000067 [Lobosporangium transversale]|uniref:Promethin n=1 Tax=Lobosporangium transversale TaxID=64571 RepID=A0A1Y2G7S2_9FUNG|nr:hypothetical protein BCR41DRAFT_426256 [Lobosporangium transversale]KAF9908654.1 hypothetical protein BX616_000067 [Lobosporangium transversale]ORZ01863.1 hypothetical protein BCR41DRAFT_426256 [Lobosporangium transversale]|eukprot:XP_021876160.1 hypothetical protein BCR41DRAFT_426256 [Lobosporangium transversale]
MTQQLDQRGPISVRPMEDVPSTFIYAGGSTNKPSSGAPTAAGAGAEKGGRKETDASVGTEGRDAADRWPSLVNIRQVITALVLETISTTRPLRDKINAVAHRSWQAYLRYAEMYPLLTALLSAIILFSAGPILVFACVTGASLGFLAGIAAVIVIIIQSIVVTIAGAILLFVLGTIVVLTVFMFLCLVAGYMAFKGLRELALIVHGQRQQYQNLQRHQQPQHINRSKSDSSDGSTVHEY